LAERLFDKIAPAVILPLVHDRLGVATDFVTSSVGKISVEAANQSLADIGMELRFKEGAVCILAGENPFLEHAFFQKFLQYSGYILEMLASFVFDAALGVPSVIARIAVAAATPRQGMKQIVEFRQFAEAKIEDASAMAVDQNYTQQWRSSEKVSQGLEVKVAVDEELRASQRRGQFVFVPDIPVCAGKHGLGMRAVAAQLP
jgi:hypothetical protein